MNSQALSDACLANKCGYHFTTLPFCLAVATGYDPAFSPVTGEYHYQASPATINLEEDNGVEPSPYHYNGPGFKSGCVPLRPIFQSILLTLSYFSIGCQYLFENYFGQGGGTRTPISSSYALRLRRPRRYTPTTHADYNISSWLMSTSFLNFFFPVRFRLPQTAHFLPMPTKSRSQTHQ